jgi:hypothetical protein
VSWSKCRTNSNFWTYTAVFSASVVADLQGSVILNSLNEIRKYHAATRLIKWPIVSVPKFWIPCNVASIECKAVVISIVNLRIPKRI